MSAVNDTNKPAARRNAVIYFTCSSKEEAESTGERLKAETESKGLGVKAVLFDRSDRPPYVLLELCSGECPFRYLIVPDRSHLTFKETSAEAFIHRFRKLGVRTVFLNGTTRQSLPGIITMLRNYYSVGGDWTRANYGEFRTAGPTAGRSTFGYYVKNGFNEINDKEAEIIRNIFKMFIAGESIPTITEKLAFQSPDSKMPFFTSAYTILRNPRYIGKPEDGAVRHAPIISEDLWLDSCARFESRGEGNVEYLMKNGLFLNDSVLFPAVETRSGTRRRVYASKRQSGYIAVDADEFEQNVIEAITGAVAPFIDSFEDTCMLYMRNEHIKHASARAATASILRSEKKTLPEAPETVNIGASIELLNESKARVRLLETELEYEDYRFEFSDIDETKVRKYFDKLRYLPDLSRAEKAYFIETLAKTVTVTDEHIEIDIPLIGTEPAVAANNCEIFNITSEFCSAYGSGE